LMPLHRLSDGRYEARYYRDGTKRSPYVREKLGWIERDEALKLYAARKASAASRRASGAHTITFASAAAKYLAIKGQKMSAAGLERAAHLIEKRFVPRFGEKRIEAIGAADCEEFLAERVREGAAKATANREWGQLRAVLRFASRKLGATSPALGAVEAFKLKNRGAKIIYLEPEEWRKLVTAFDDEERFREFIQDRRRLNGRKRDSDATTDYLARLRKSVLAMKLLLFTGARLADVVRLTWLNVDFGRNRITIAQGKANERPVILPMQPTLRKHLLSVERNEERVIGMSEIQVQRAFRVARALTGLRHAITPHALRHTLGSWLAMEGVSLRTIQEILGHSDPAITARHYAHLAPSSLGPALNRIPAIARRLPKGLPTKRRRA
jgi:integrase